MGRKKISMQKIKDEKIRNITYYKRRRGLLKKAMELSLLCDIDVIVGIYPKQQISQNHSLIFCSMNNVDYFIDKYIKNPFIQEDIYGLKDVSNIIILLFNNITQYESLFTHNKQNEKQIKQINEKGINDIKNMNVFEQKNNNNKNSNNSIALGDGLIFDKNLNDIKLFNEPLENKFNFQEQTLINKKENKIKDNKKENKISNNKICFNIQHINDNNKNNNENLNNNSVIMPNFPPYFNDIKETINKNTTKNNQICSINNKFNLDKYNNINLIQTNKLNQINELYNWKNSLLLNNNKNSIFLNNYANNILFPEFNPFLNLKNNYFIPMNTFSDFSNSSLNHINLVNQNLNSIGNYINSNGIEKFVFCK